MNQSAATMVQDSLATAQNDRRARACQTYRRLLARLGEMRYGDRFTVDEADELARVMDELGLRPRDVDLDLDALKEEPVIEAEVEDATAVLASFPQSRELEQQMREMEADLAEKIDAMLEPKRQLAAKIEAREDAMRDVKTAKGRLQALRQAHPNLF